MSTGKFYNIVNFMKEEEYMKFMKKFACVLALVLCITAIPFSNAKAAQEGVAVYRLYSPITHEHLFTADKNERDTLYLTGAWGYEGVAWYASGPEGEPVYRLYNTCSQNHLYTMSQNEINTLLSMPGTDWIIDNNGNPVFYSAGTENVYRLYNYELKGMHLLTTDANEYNVLATVGWDQEGYQMKCYATGSPIPESLYYGQTGPGSVSELYTPETYVRDYTVMPTGTANISNTASAATIEADVTLDGSGTGSHAKLVMSIGPSAVSFGLQYDTASQDARFRNRVAFMIENIDSNNPGGQQYSWSPYVGELGKTYHLMLTVDENGGYKGYINGAEVVSGVNEALSVKSMASKGQKIYPWVEASARLDGDSVDAKFQNVKLKTLGDYKESYRFFNTPVVTNDGISIVPLSGNDVEIKGTITGLGAGNDWDNKYDIVSGVYRYDR